MTEQEPLAKLFQEAASLHLSPATIEEQLWVFMKNAFKERLMQFA